MLEMTVSLTSEIRMYHVFCFEHDICWADKSWQNNHCRATPTQSDAHLFINKFFVPNIIRLFQWTHEVDLKAVRKVSWWTLCIYMYFHWKEISKFYMKQNVTGTQPSVEEYTVLLCIGLTYVFHLSCLAGTSVMGN